MDYIGNYEYSKKWLNIANCEDKLDWSLSITTTFPILFENLTLHDSFWRNKVFNNESELILIIELDGYWNYEFLKKKTKEEGGKEWPFLFIKIPKVINVCFGTRQNNNTIMRGISKFILEVEKKEWIGSIKDSKVFSEYYINRLRRTSRICKTEIYDLQGAMEIVHEPEIQIMIIEKDGTYVDPEMKKIKALENIKRDNKKEFDLIYRMKRYLNRIWYD